MKEKPWIEMMFARKAQRRNLCFLMYTIMCLVLLPIFKWSSLTAKLRWKKRPVAWTR